MGNPMPRVWTPWQGTIQRPLPLRKSSGWRPSNPRKRVQWVSATHNSVARKAWRVRLKACPGAQEPDINVPNPNCGCCSSPGLMSRNRRQLPNEFNHGRADRNKDDGRQNKNNQRGNHLDRGLGGLLLGTLSTFGAEGIGMHAKSLRDARSKTVSLYECTNEGADVVNSGALNQVAESFGAGFAGAHFQVDEVKLVAEVGMSVVKILANAHQSLIESEPGLDADDGEVKRVRQSQSNSGLSVADHALQNEAGKNEPQSGNADEQRGIPDTGQHGDGRKADGRHQDASPKVVVDVHGIAVPRLHEPAPRS